jgi:hypothetical protein
MAKRADAGTAAGSGPQTEALLRAFPGLFCAHGRFPPLVRAEAVRALARRAPRTAEALALLETEAAPEGADRDEAAVLRALLANADTLRRLSAAVTTPQAWTASAGDPAVLGFAARWGSGAWAPLAAMAVASGRPETVLDAPPAAADLRPSLVRWLVAWAMEAEGEARTQMASVFEEEDLRDGLLVERVAGGAAQVWRMLARLHRDEDAPSMSHHAPFAEAVRDFLIAALKANLRALLSAAGAAPGPAEAATAAARGVRALRLAPATIGADYRRAAIAAMSDPLAEAERVLVQRFDFSQPDFLPDVEAMRAIAEIFAECGRQADGEKLLRRHAAAARRAR